MTSCWISRALKLLLGIIVAVGLPAHVSAQKASDQSPTPSDSLWGFLKSGRVALDVRYRFEAFERDGPPFTAPAYAPTLRIALGYGTPVFHGFSAFAEGEAVTVTGPADYSDPTLPSQNRPNLPAILDPKSLEPNQFYVNWMHRFGDKKISITVGRQEMRLNDGRFLANSTWRQVHGSFDAARFDAFLPRNFTFTYAFINRFNREVGYDALDGSPPMHTHVFDLAWSRPEIATLSLYGLLVNYRSQPQFNFSTQTYGIRASGPYQLNRDWNLIYTAEFANQQSYGNNPFYVNANYYLGEIGPAWRGFGLKASYAFLAGHSPTNLLTTPMSPPFNGWTDLFFNDPIVGQASGLKARYISGTGPIRKLGDTTATVIYYDYHSDHLNLHYGSELDAAVAYKVKGFEKHWEIGMRFGRYWSDRLFTNAVRASAYSSYTL